MAPPRRKFRAAAVRSGLSSSSPSHNAIRTDSPGPDVAYRSINVITPSEKRKSTPRPKIIPSLISDLPEALLLHIFSFFVSNTGVEIEEYLNIQAVDMKFYTLMNCCRLWQFVPLSWPDGSMNINAFSYIKQKNKGTEGYCFKARRRRDNSMVALKRARVYPSNEGVPYYMMRELAALKRLSHPNICPLQFVNLHNFKLYLIFPYVEMSLQDILSPYVPPLNRLKNYTVNIQKHQICHIMGQLVSAVDYCHCRGILHRNLKPKHILVIPGPNLADPIEHCIIQLADFALVRTLTTPPKKLTSEVITLWYRPPEILMGQRNYTAAVDIWSIGCIFAELIQGRAIFEGLCEIDQIFQIFRILGTPSDESWSGFTELPNYQVPIFPNWKTNRLWGKVPLATPHEFDLLNKCFRFDPTDRLSASEMLRHPYFDETEYFKPPTISARELQLERAGLINMQKTTISQYLFLISLEDELAVLSYKRPEQGSQCDSSGIGLYSLEDLESRRQTAEWIVCIAGRDDSSLSTRTAYFAIALFDAFFHTNISSERPSGLNKATPYYVNSKWPCQSHSVLVGACCLHIASKCEDVSYAGIRDISLSLNEEYEGNDFLNMEERVLNTLQFNFYIPTVIDFLGIFVTIIPEIYNSSPAQISLCMYLGELSFYYALTCCYRPSILATAIVSYALTYTSVGGRNYTPGIDWPQTLETLSGYTKADIIDCQKDLRNSMRNVQADRFTCDVVFSHYSLLSNHEVARWSPHDIPSLSSSLYH